MRGEGGEIKLVHMLIKRGFGMSPKEAEVVRGEKRVENQVSGATRDAEDHFLQTPRAASAAREATLVRS